MSAVSQNWDYSLVPVILAGGSGTRLWPLSREKYPKQFIAFEGKATLFQKTIQRINLFTSNPPIIISNNDMRFLVAEQLRELKIHDASILLEPIGRNTAPAIALAALEAISDNDDPIMLLLPSDHKIIDDKNFNSCIEKAIPNALNGEIVTFGIKPDEPATGYGYIKIGRRKNSGLGFEIDCFIEKPDMETANSYLSSGDYFWNSGIFLIKSSIYLKELEKFRPDILQICKKTYLSKTGDLDFIRFDENLFLSCPEDSIDFAIMEKTDLGVVMPMDIGWSDLGSWDSLWKQSEKDNFGNYKKGDVVTIASSGNYISSESRLVACVGLTDMIVVECKDALLVARKTESHKIKDLMVLINEMNREEAIEHREVFRPWGKYDRIDGNIGFQVKRISVNPHSKLSVQKHQYRSEHWVVVKGTALVTKGKDTFVLNENESTYIPSGLIHALENPGSEILEIIEVQTGGYLGEDDITRIEDNYGRA